MTSKDKKRLIISYKHLSEELQNKFNLCYSEGYSNFIQKITKPDGSQIFVVPFETEDTSYMVKVDVKIDERISDEEFDKDLFTSDDDEETTVSTEEEGGENKKRIVLMHGDYSSVDRADESSE
ncbi:MAG: hypothetical protein LBR17_01680 [Bacteroidales bacterium]|jgi:hypothetical protein|nr:hypothetical protein [Bacteroidales bacterium]